MHVFGDDAAHAPCDEARYTNPQAPAELYWQLLKRWGVDRCVLVQPSYYGRDNRLLLEQLQLFGDRACGIVMVEIDEGIESLSRLADTRVRGLRIDLYRSLAAGASTCDISADLRRTEALAARLGFSLDLYAPGHLLAALADELACLEVPITIAHMGSFRPDELGGVAAARQRFAAFVEKIERGNCWMKLTGAYRIAPNDRDLTSFMARHIVELMPDRALWGSDWPHVMTPFQDSASTLAQLAEWCLQSALRDRILVDNPARLYGFSV